MPEHAVKTRFCPSPTGNMTLGNTRTALFSALYALSQQGGFVLRIEDTDKERSSEAAEKQLYQDMRWLGMAWTEGPDMGGDLGPYHQSQRQAVYDTFYTQLAEQGDSYPCFCAEEALAAARKRQLAQKKPPRYPGTCRNLSAEEAQKRIAAGEPHTLRLRIDRKARISFDDFVKGPQRFKGQDIGDFIIRRADGTAPFMFCNAIDDALMGVTHALRGEDHLTNTPRQLLILQALGLKGPQYGHIALIVGADGRPLSKRTGSMSIVDCAAQGYLPAAITNYLFRLGHSVPDLDNDLLGWAEMAQRFSLQHLSHAPGRFDPQQLHFWQKQAVHAMSDDDFAHWAGEDVRSLVPEKQWHDFIALIKPNCCFPAEVKAFAHYLCADQPAWTAEQLDLLKQAGNEFFASAAACLGEDFKAWAAAIKDDTGASGKQLFMPLRVALTGQSDGPQLADVFNFMLKNNKLEKRLDVILKDVKDR